MNRQELESTKVISRGWNNLDTRFFENHLSNDIIYKSQWVSQPIVGKEKYLSYMRLKFFALRESRKTDFMSITAELAFQRPLEYQPCVVLTQITKDLARQVLILIESKKRKISRIDVCKVPDDPEEIQLTGEFPT